MKNVLQRLTAWKDKIFLGLIFLQFGLTANAQQSSGAGSGQQVDLTNLQATSGAGSKQITDMMTKTTTTANATVNTGLVIFALIGVIMVGSSLLAIHKASKDDRDSPKTAIVGLVVGGCLTAVAVIVGVIRNFLLN